MTHVRTSPYYPQSNGKIERWHKSLKSECIRPGTPLSLEDARRLVEGYVEHYNNVRLNSATGYITPTRHAGWATAGDSRRTRSKVGSGAEATADLPPASRRERRRCQSLDSPAVIGLAFFFYHRQSLCKKIRAVTTTSDVRGQDDLYQQAASEYGAALARLARGYEADPDKQRDLLQEIHISLWRSLEGFDGLCSLRTWVYRVAHNAATSYVIRQRRARPQMLVSLDEVEALPIEGETDRKVALNQLTALIQRLKPSDRQVILAWLDGMDAAEIGELTGLSSGNVATKVHRIKSILARDFQGARNGRS